VSNSQILVVESLISSDEAPQKRTRI